MGKNCHRTVLHDYALRLRLEIVSENCGHRRLKDGRLVELLFVLGGRAEPLRGSVVVVGEGCGLLPEVMAPYPSNSRLDGSEILLPKEAGGGGVPTGDHEDRFALVSN